MPTLPDLEQFPGLDRAARERLSRELADRLGPDWSPGTQEPIDGLLLSHAPTASTFVLVPGGSFVLGLSDDDVEDVKRSVGWTPEIRQLIEALRPHVTPAHRVVVAPFLVSRRALTAGQVERVSQGKYTGKYCHTLPRPDARDLARSLGLRLASEAELQWIARDGGAAHFTLDAAVRLDDADHDSEQIPSRFGLGDVFLQQWAEDDYHDDYQGAPGTSAPWMDGEPCGVATGWTMPEYVEEPQQRIGLLACLRTNRTHKKAAIRFAAGLPA